MNKKDPLAQTDLFGERVSKQTTSALRRRFIFPPFSVLNTRDGEWQRRKRLWLKLGIQSELGRDTDIVPNGSRRSAKQDGAWSRSYGRGRPLKTNAIVNSKAVEKYPYFAGRGGG